MNFRTQIPISKTNNPIDYDSKIVSLGSCFAENITDKLNYFKFQNSCNPFGILFHPLAIEKLIEFAISEKKFSEKDIFFHNERWHSYDTHSDLSNSFSEELIENLNTTILSTKQQISEATHIIITYGTSWIYRNIKNNTIVANCHKVPQKQFCKEILSVETIEKSIKNTLDLIRKANSKAAIIFTVSPVRHIKDGFIENQVSKANLITAIYRLLQIELYKPNTAYFPSYEIMMDELRDYRFYAQDMLHPSQIAIDYIWERFNQTHLKMEVHSIMEQVCTIQKGLQHRPFHPNSEEYHKFLMNLELKKLALNKQVPHIKF